MGIILSKDFLNKFTLAEPEWVEVVPGEIGSDYLGKKVIWTSSRFIFLLGVRRKMARIWLGFGVRGAPSAEGGLDHRWGGSELCPHG